MKFKLKHGVIYQGVMYRAGELIDISDNDLNYSFNWLKKYLVPTPDMVEAPAINDGLVANGLPPLDTPKRGKKNGDA